MLLIIEQRDESTYYLFLRILFRFIFHYFSFSFFLFFLILISIEKLVYKYKKWDTQSWKIKSG